MEAKPVARIFRGRTRASKRWFTANSVTLLAVAFQLLVERTSQTGAATGGGGGSPNTNNRQQHYYGTLIGRLNRRDHNVSGEVFAVDEQTLFIRNFNYDGLAPDAYFWSSVSAPQPSALDGFIVPDEKGSTKPLERYLDKDVVLRLPEGRTLREINWLSIWSRQTKLSLGDISIPRQQLIIPRPLEIGPFSQLAHGLKSGPITIVDAQTFLVPDFHYDGLGPAAYFWLTRGSQGLTANGLRLKDENGSGVALKKYSGETVVITLPEELTIYDFDFFGVWCKEFQVNFGQTRIPQSAKVPPSPKMLGIKPENKLNCEILYDDLGYEIRWVLDGDDIVMQLVGKIEPGEYMAFGLGKDDSRSDMQNADAVVTWVDRTSGQVHAIDYFLGAKQQCQQAAAQPTAEGSEESSASLFTGSCPDNKLPGGGDSLTLLHGAIVNGYSMVTFKRPQLGIDELYDQHVYSDGQQSVLWAIGTLNSKKEIGYHRLKTRSNMFIDFARNPQWNCPIPDLNATMHTSHMPITSASQVDPTVVTSPGESSIVTMQALQAPGQPAAVGAGRLQATPRQQVASAAAPITLTSPTDQVSTTRSIEEQSQQAEPSWFIPAIVCPADRTFYAQIGPTGGHKGYEALTGRTSWGVSWYINGLMIPELVVERGQTYRFVVEGGSDKTSTTRRHPFYLTDSQEGGFDFKTDDERMKEHIFGGVALRGDGQFVPTAEGRLCEWKQTNNTLSNPDLYQTFAAYQRSLRLDCLPGQSSMLKFAPDANTPDLIYYQCYTHRFMGWRIRVVNSCSAFMNSLSRSSSPTGGGSSQRTSLGGNNLATSVSNNIKRDFKKSFRENKTEMPRGERSIYNRRSLTVSSSSSNLPGVDHLHTASSEPRMSLQELSNQAQFMQEFQSDNSEPMTTGRLPSDMLILNNSQLIQRQPYNLSSFDEIVKLSPADLEFIDQQPDSTLEPYLNAAFNQQQFANLPLHNLSQSSTTIKPSENRTSTSKSPKTLQSYMRRLASIYYPVQQQLASMLASQSTTTGSGGGGGGTTTSGSSSGPQGAGLAGSQAAASQTLAQTSSVLSNGLPDQSVAHPQSGSSFSLSNLVPKSKIDLSKSTISKKLNKLRFKSGRKYEVQQAKPSQPPTPANEFNYDIFNNQLAQLEKQQKQFQSLEMASSWPMQQQQQQQPGDSFNYLPMMTVSSEEQQAIDSMNNPQSTQVLLGNIQPAYNPYLHNGGLGSSSKQPMMTASYQQQQQSPPRYLPPRQPLRYSEIPLGPPNNLGQQPYVIDYLSMMFNRTGDSPIGGQVGSSMATQPSYQYNNNNNPSASRQQVHLQRPNSRPQAQTQAQFQQPAIYITRLPQPLSYPLFEAIKSQQQQQQQQQSIAHDMRLWPNNAARYPSIAPYANNPQLHSPDSQQVNNYPTTTSDYSSVNQQMSTMPSLAMTTHDTLENGIGYAIPIGGSGGQDDSPNGAGQQEIESLSGSGSGSHYDFRQRPSSKASELTGGQQVVSDSQSNAKMPSRFQQPSADHDHMLAIERFSKQSSERRLPSIVHPVTGEHVHVPQLTLSDLENFNHQQQQQATNYSSQALPRRFSALLIDKHLVASSSVPTPSELLDVDQTTIRAGDLRRINISETNNNSEVTHSQPATRIVLISGETDPNKIHQRVGSSFANGSTSQPAAQTSDCNGATCQQLVSQSTTESVTPVLVKPNNFEYYRDQIAASSTPSTSPSSSAAASITTMASAPTTTPPTSTEGPLTPSFGPPSVGSSTFSNEEIGSNKLADDDLVYKSTLVEPIASTLMHTPSMWPSKNANNFNQHHHQVNQFNFDNNPFTPIELTNPMYYATNPQQFAASNLLSSRLRPPLIESMLRQHQNPFRPEPPVQVASYLAQHLSSHNPMFISSERSVVSNQPMALSVSIPVGSSGNSPGSGNDAQQQQQQQQQVTFSKQNNNSHNNNHYNRTNELIILKPAVLTKQSPQTYLLKPEYLTNQFKLAGPGEGSSSSSSSADLYYTNELGEPTARRLAGHQFDRLSSLSSPPSTSIALDPMQAANTVASYARHGLVNDSRFNDSPGGAESSGKSPTSGNLKMPDDSKQQSNSTTTTIVVDSTSQVSHDNLGQHRQTSYLPSKPIPFSFDNIGNSLSSSNPDGLRLNPGGESAITSSLYRDNNTDNAILSHVMSLISSNAIPTPPLIPVASYSTADYFLPTSDRFHRSLRG